MVLLVRHLRGERERERRERGGREREREKLNKIQQHLLSTWKQAHVQHTPSGFMTHHARTHYKSWKKLDTPFSVIKVP